MTATLYIGLACRSLSDAAYLVRSTAQVRAQPSLCYHAPSNIKVGILVHGNNHFIVRGPLPDRDTAQNLVRHWTVIQIGRSTPPDLQQWTIVTREFRENLEWAAVIPGDGEISPAVTQLLNELTARGVRIHEFGNNR